MNRTQKGFAALETLLILVIITVISGVGWYAIHTKHQTDQILAQSEKTSQSTPSNQAPDLKTYSNTEYGFSFQYPNSWRLVTALSDSGRGGNEGDIYVESPGSTKVHFGPDFGGKGGDCIDPQTNTRTTRTCTTRDILSVETLKSPGAQAAYLVKASDTAPLIDNGKKTYFIYLDSGYDKPVIGSNINAFLGTYDDIIINRNNGKFVYLGVFVEGTDDVKNNSANFFDSQEIKEAIPVLESFRVQ